MCPHEEKLTAWLLGDLPPGERQAMSRHLETCAACRGVREDLARVLTPLRSGLEKDRSLRIAPAPAQSAPRRALTALWSMPHEGLKRAAILALSFGTLFALLSAIYPSFQRPPPNPDTTTYVSFFQAKEEPPPPLAPEAELKGDAADASLLARTPAPAEPVTVPPAPLVMPGTPAPVRQAPAFPQIGDAEAAREATRKSLAAKQAKPAPAATAPAPGLSTHKTAAAKRERSKSASAPAARAATTDVTLRDYALAAARPAPTNATPTNAVSTNAVSPAIKHTP